MSLVGWLFSVLTPFCKRVWETVEHLLLTFSIMGLSHHCTSWRSVQNLKLTNNMWVHLQGDMSAWQFVPNVPSLGEGKLPLIPSIGLSELQNTLCCIRTT